MNPEHAKLILMDEAAITALAARHTDTADAVREALEAARQTPAILTRMTDGLAAIVSDEALTMEAGVFIPARELTTEDAARICKNTASFFTSTDNVGNMGRWVLGNIMTVMNEQGLDPGEFVEATELAYNTIATSITTFKFFRARRYPMPFSHHKEIAYAGNLDETRKHAIAAYASDQGLALTSVRAIIKLAQKEIAENRRPEPIEALHAQTTAIQPQQLQRRFIVLAGATSRLVDHLPVGTEAEEADEIYEIRGIIKSRAEPGGTGDAGQPDVPDDAPGEPDGPGEG